MGLLTLSVVAAQTPAAPDAPGMLSVERGADATSLDVSWAASEANGATITGYTVRWKPSAQMHYDSADQTDAGDLGATATEHTITGLTAGTEYTVQVRAEATVGADEADSAWAEATGTPAAAPAAPTLAAANIEAGDEQLVVSWEAPAASGATISGYTVRWQDSASPDFFDSADQATVTSLSYTITGLDNGTAYTVQVRADATIGAAAANSDWSSEATGTPVAMPDAPGDLSIERGADATSLDVSWAASEANGATITGYTVRWKPSAQAHYDSADQTDAGDLGATATEHTITGLTAGTEYTVQVRAEATVGADEADSAWAEATGTPAAAPAAPTLAAANIEAGHEQLVVSWEAPAASGATISGYTVRWQDSASPDDVFDSADQATVTNLSYTITGLDNGTAYTVQVRADATIGAAAANSDWSSEATGTPVAMPDAPGDLSIERGADATSLDVSWAASEANGATITGYTVRWKPSAQAHYDSADQTDAGDLGATATEHTITGLTAGTEYTVQVRAEATVGADEADSAWAEATGTPAAAPAAPTLAAANIEAGHEQLVVSWEAPAASGATISGYTVRWQDSASPDVFDSADQATVTSLSYTITGLDNGTAYTVQVRAGCHHRCCRGQQRLVQRGVRYADRHTGRAGHVERRARC